MKGSQTTRKHVAQSMTRADEFFINKAHSTRYHVQTTDNASDELGDHYLESPLDDFGTSTSFCYLG